MKILLATLLVTLSPLAAHADDPANVLMDCWDGTFAYNTMKVADSQDGPHLLRVELASEDQKHFLANVPVAPKAGWGQAKLAFYMPRANCVETVPGRHDIIRCEIRNDGILELGYDESIESRKELRLIIRDLVLETTLANEGKVIRASVTFDAGSVGKGSVGLGFRTRENGACNNFHQ